MFAVSLTYVVRAIIQKLLENVIVLETEKPKKKKNECQRARSRRKWAEGGRQGNQSRLLRRTQNGFALHGNSYRDRRILPPRRSPPFYPVVAGHRPASPCNRVKCRLSALEPDFHHLNAGALPEQNRRFSAVHRLGNAAGEAKN